MIAKKRKSKNRWLGNFFLTIFFCIFVFSLVFLLLSSNLKLKKKRAEILEKIAETQREIERLEKENQAFQNQILSKKSEDYLEKEAREHLGLKKTGEEVAVILEKEIEKSPLPQPKEERSFWQKLKEFFQNF